MDKKKSSTSVGAKSKKSDNKSKIANPKVKLNDINCNGIYLFNFHDGTIKFVQDLPIINGTHKGLVNKREGQVISEFDGRSIIVYFKNKYFIYLRKFGMIFGS